MVNCRPQAQKTASLIERHFHKGAETLAFQLSPLLLSGQLLWLLTVKKKKENKENSIRSIDPHRLLPIVDSDV